MNRIFSALVLAWALSAVDASAGIVTFGQGTNQFAMEFVTIGNPGNAPDTTGIPKPAGAVSYVYSIGKFEVSRDMITKYNAATENASLQITLADMTAFGGNGPNKPATGATWSALGRFVNWLNTSTGGYAAYKLPLTGGVDDALQVWTAADIDDFDATNPFRSKRAKYFFPNYNEWYKAAYYSPSGVYYDYPTGSDTAPTAVASGKVANTAVYGGQSGPADVDQAGGLSSYGVMGLGGNVWEWEETNYYFEIINTYFLSDRGARGGEWRSNAGDLSSSIRGGGNAHAPFYYNNFGFRVVSLSSSNAAVPEPSTMVIGTILGLGGLLGKRRMKR
jgi:hypothetical protein